MMALACVATPLVRSALRVWSSIPIPFMAGAFVTVIREESAWDRRRKGCITRRVR